MDFSLAGGLDKSLCEGAGFTFLEPVSVKGTITNFKGKFLAEGFVSTSLSLLCSRCLAPVEIDMNFKLHETFASSDNENDETESLKGNVIELDDVLCRGIVSRLPMKPLCGEDCKGLCFSCGADLNKLTCACARDSETDPRFSGLRAVFKLDEEV